MLHPSNWSLRAALAGVALATLASAAIVAEPPKVVPTPTAGPPKSPVEIENEVIDAKQSAFADDLALTQQSGRDFDVVTKGKKPEEAALGASYAAAAKEQIEVASALAVEARGRQAEAARYDATAPAFAQQIRREAVRKLDAAQGYLDRANAIYNPQPTAPPPLPAAARGPVVDDACAKSGTCRLLIQIDKKKGGVGGTGVFEFDSDRALPILPPPRDPARDNVFKGRPPPPPPVRTQDSSTLVLPMGQSLSTEGLRDAVAEVDPQAAEGPLFVQCGEGACPGPGLLGVLGDEAKRGELRRIGGVSLDVTFDILGFSGMSELRGGADIAVIEHPVLISLSALANAAQPWIDNWDNLPDAIRYPGGIGRIHGFVLSQDGKDLVLIGSPATTPKARIDIDSLSIALRTIWRDGAIPAVSLDPRVDEMGGPQFSRVLAIPADSVMAKTMLDADYAMKAINIGAGWAGPLDLTGRSAIAARLAVDSGPALSRFWLTPQPMRRESMYRSTSGRTVLFESAVQVQTEQMFVQNGELVGIGSKGGFEQALADAFTRAYPRLEVAPGVQPDGVFAGLHGVTDAAVLARGLRELMLRPAVLDRMAALPYRSLTGAAAVPLSYPGLSSRIEVGGGVIEVSGGAVMQVKPALGLTQPVRDHVGVDLERMVDQRRPVIATSSELPLVVPLGQTLPPSAIDDALLAASRALGREDWAAAETAFAMIAAQHPEMPAAQYGLAQALMGAGRLTEAVRPLARALVLVPDDPAGVALLRDLAWQLDPAGTFATLSADERAALSRRYAGLALGDGRDGRIDRAARHAQWAVQLDPDNGEAYLARAFLAPPASRAREQDLALAIRSYRRHYTAVGGPGRLRLDMALLVAAKHHALRGVLAVSTGQSLVAKTMLSAAQREAIEASQLDPGSVEAATTRLVVTTYLDRVIDPSATTPPAVTEELEQLAKRFPGDPLVWFAQTQVMMLDRRWDEAQAAITRAIALQPDNPLYYWTRAFIAVGSGNCGAGRVDFAMARQLAGVRASTLGFDPVPACAIGF